MNIHDALQRNELMEYLAGYPQYAIVDQYAESPTDPSAAFEPFRTRIIEDATLRLSFLEALRSLAAEPEYGWMAIYYLHSLRILEGHKKIRLIEQELVDSISSSLLKNKSSLSLNRKWVGAMYENGLWGDVQRMNRILARDHNLTVLPEEL